MTKSKPCNALTSLIDTNSLNLKTTGWVERTTEHPWHPWHPWRSRLMRAPLMIIHDQNP
jgi:hypothetical protein